MGFARKGEASAVGVLMERHPLETQPARLEALRWALLCYDVPCAGVC